VKVGQVLDRLREDSWYLGATKGSHDETVQETETMIREAIEFHLEGLRADSLPIPPPSSQVEYVEVSV
jgi:hypothetical protein